MMWFVIGMLVLVVGGAATLYLVLHLTNDHEEPAPFSPDDSSPLGDTSEHAGSGAADEEGGDTHLPPDAPGAPSGDVLPVGRFHDKSSDA